MRKPWGTIVDRFKNFLLLMMLILLVLPGTVLANDSSVSQNTHDQVTQLIGEYHVSGVTPDELQDQSIDEMIESLDDPYTMYFSEEDWDQFENSLENQYVGIGVRVGMDDEGFYVDEVFAGSPAEKGGLAAGDYFVKVEDVSTEGKSLDELVGMIKGPEGTTVHLTVSRQGKSLKIETTREQIKIPVVASRMFDGQIGYLSLSDFSSDADEKFAEGLEVLHKQGMKSLIIDLRNNPGGLLASALNIAGNFIEDGVLIHTRDRNSVDHPVNITGGKTQDIPVFVLINQNSASASEVLTGALQDYHKATVIGTRSYGKGSVQSIFPLKDGGYLKLTIEEYLTPKKRKVNGVGLVPDVIVPESLPQLLTALHIAGSDAIDLRLDSRSYTVNGQKFNQLFPTIEENGKVYVPLRILAAEIGARIGWNEATQSVVLTKKTEKRLNQSSGDGFKMEHGISYYALDDFKKLYPGLDWSRQGDTLEIHFN